MEPGFGWLEELSTIQSIHYPALAWRQTRGAAGGEAGMPERGPGCEGFGGAGGVK